MKRRELLTGLASASALAGLAPTLRALAQSGAAGATLTYGQSTAVLTLDPAHGTFTAYPGGYEAALCLYDRLLDFDAQMTISPQLAESFAMADDLMSATLKLRAGLRFHDDTPCDAAAVRVNLERLMDKERNPTNRPLWDPIAGVETSDPATIVIRLKTPFSQLPNSLAHGSGAIVSPAALASFGETGIAQHPVGAGPFKMTSFTPGQELVVEAFDHYWGGKPATAKIVFRAIAEPATRLSALRTGAVDVIDAVPVALIGPLKGDAALSIISKPGLRPMGFAINLSHEPLNDARVRQALNLAVPVETIAEKLFFGYARAPDSPLAFNTAGYHPVGKLTFDQAKAKALLAEAGFSATKPLKIALFTPQGLFPNDVAVSEIVANALKQVGVDVTITKIEGGAYWDALRQDRANLKWDLAMFGFNPSNASGLYHLASLFKANADDAARPDVWNIGRYRNPKVDELISQADRTGAKPQQDALLAQAQELIWNDNPYLWLQVNENISAARKAVKGVEVWPIVFTSLRHATL
ncbi:peptide/nickel transport system substrate-binding protein/glutathione transport system substrate-binding protein [Rhizobiales bacterium GAS113]|nr:peptide/nickel transport system substrate-binding protein/glutathione transport system substrate-binding protein [Rhizobiales bacterium GAS113]